MCKEKIRFGWSNRKHSLFSVRLWLLALLGMGLMGTPALAQVSDTPELKFVEHELRYDAEGTLYIDFDIEVLGAIISKDEALHLVPVYRKASGEEITLPPVVISGTLHYRYNQRETALMSHSRYEAEKPYEIAVLKKYNPYAIVHYRQTLKGAGAGTLRVDHYLEDCCDLMLVGRTDILVGDAEPEEPVVAPKVLDKRSINAGQLVLIRPADEVVKKRSDRMTIRIQFVVARHDINPSLPGNAEELRRVDDFFRALRNDRVRYKIETSTIHGYASPEAPYDYNLKLSQRRADSFRNYLMTRYGLHDVNAVGMGEDWEGLRRAVESSAMPSRDQVLSIIDFVDLFGGREKQLMDLEGGRPYHYMLQVLYPPLRRMEMEVSYEVEAVAADEREGIYSTRPQDLSEAELFELAMSRNRESATYGDELILAAKYFPESVEAQLNASSIALLRGNSESAWKYLEPLQQDPRAYNNIGLYHYLNHRDTEARIYFLRAAKEATTAEVATRNLQMLRN